MKLSSRLVLALSLAACTASVGCTAAPQEDAQEGDSVESPLTGADPNAPGVTIPSPDGTYFAEVKANGSGCPAGTWDTSIAPDGTTFTVTFSDYGVSVDPGQLLGTKDCALAIRLHTPQGFSFSVADFYYSGYAYMDKAGMSGKQTAKYYFQGNPIPSESVSKQKTIRGPYDSDFLFEEKVGIADLVWSPCGRDSALNVQSRLRLLNEPHRKGTGVMSTLSVDGNVQLKFALKWRKCS